MDNNKNANNPRRVLNPNPLSVLDNAAAQQEGVPNSPPELPATGPEASPAQILAFFSGLSQQEEEDLRQEADQNLEAAMRARRAQAASQQHHQAQPRAVFGNPQASHQIANPASQQPLQPDLTGLLNNFLQNQAQNLHQRNNAPVPANGALPGISNNLLPVAQIPPFRPANDPLQYVGGLCWNVLQLFVQNSNAQRARDQMFYRALHRDVLAAVPQVRVPGSLVAAAHTAGVQVQGAHVSGGAVGNPAIPTAAAVPLQHGGSPLFGDQALGAQALGAQASGAQALGTQFSRPDDASQAVQSGAALSSSNAPAGNVQNIGGSPVDLVSALLAVNAQTDAGGVDATAGGGPNSRNKRKATSSEAPNLNSAQPKRKPRQPVNYNGTIVGMGMENYDNVTRKWDSYKCTAKGCNHETVTVNELKEHYDSAHRPNVQ